MHWAHQNRTITEVQNYWDARPCNVRHSDAPIGSRQYFDEVEEKKYAMEPHIISFANFGHWRGKNVLEVGCGIGTDTASFIRHGANILAVDLSKESVAIAKKHVQQALHDTHRPRNTAVVLQADVEDEGFALEANRFDFDLIYSFGVLHHTPHPDVALRNLREIAHPNTQLRIMLYHRWSSKAIRLGFTDKRVAQGSEAQPDTPVTYAFSRRRARKLLEATGWEVQYMYVHHIFPYKGDLYGQGIYEKGFPWKHMPVELFRKIERVVGWHLLIVAKPKEKSNA
jgi:2-polyprenyl-3-methyl-5-hydroxy-6-metoxy-1,4-benzoquinol methylase